MTETEQTVHDRMLNGKPMILINNNDNENPIYRVLVQTPGPLPYKDMGIGDVEYTEEAIREAMPSLVGIDVVDELSSHERNLGLKPKPFASVVNADYCPQYGGYADLEIYNKDYQPVFENMLKNRKTTKRKFSTEAQPLDMENVGDNNYKLNKLQYDGLVMTMNPRDKKTGLCSVLLNSKNFKEDNGGDSMPEYNKEDIEQFQKRISELEDENKTLKTDYEHGKKLYTELKPEDFKEYTELLTEKEALYQQLVPVWTAQEGEKLELVNSLVEKLPEDEQESARKDFESMDMKALKLINSIPKGKAPKGVTTTETHEQTSDEPTQEELEAAYKAMGIKQ